MIELPARTASAISAELIKIRSLRSMATTLALTTGLTVALGLVAGRSLRLAIDRGSTLVGDDFSPVSAGFEAMSYGQLGLIVFGVLVVAQEYATGTIRISLMAVPGRTMFYTAKLMALSVVALAVAIPVCVLSFAGTQVGLGPHGVSLLATDIPRALAGGVVYLTMVCMFAAGLAWIVRSPVAALSILIPFFFVLPTILAAIPATKGLARILPGSAGAGLTSVGQVSGDHIGPAASGGVLAAWTVAALVAGYLLLRRQDA